VLGGFDVQFFVLGSLYLVPALLLVIPAHELAHALAAYRMGDRSVLAFGYLKPQVRRFIDPYGVVAVFLLNVAWGRPAPVQSGRVGYGRSHALYALAGPAANLVLAVVFGAALRAMLLAGIPARPLAPSQPLSMLAWLVFAIFFLNLSTCVFQLLPIPGLDGWEVVTALFRRRNPRFFMQVEFNRQTIWVVCAAIVFFGPYLLQRDVLGLVLGLLFAPLSNLILGTCGNYVMLHPCQL
jgi:Zn-dependent protease